jgi:hypothetical protein
MTKLNRRGRKLFLTLSAIAAATAVSYSQTVLISPTGDGGFETGASFAANNWQTAQITGANRKWYCGTGQTGYTGSRAAFIGNSTTAVGTNTAARTVHLYKTVTVPAGATNIQLSFKYKQAIADNTYDYLTVRAATQTPVNGSELTTGLVTTVDPEADGQYGTFTTVTATVPNSVAGSTFNLVFTFICDNVTPHAYGAVDDVSLVYTPAPDCSGTPVAGTVGLAAPVCATEQAQLQLSGSSPFSGINIQWQSSADGITYTNVPGANSSNLSASQAATTYYQAVVTCSFSGASVTSNAVQVGQLAGCYCAAGATDTDPFFEKIDNVSIGAINNSSTSAGGYENYTTLSATLQKGTAQAITIQSAGSYSGDQVMIWIDYNQDGDFGDVNELVYTSPAQAGPYSTTITVPFTALNGPTRMRIRLDDSTDGPNATPCGNSTYGQVEDYLVNIVCPAIAAPTVSGDSFCAGETATLTATASLGTISWYDASTGGLLAGSGGSLVTPALSATTSYFAEASVSGCPASARTEAIATLSATPSVNAGADFAVCEGEEATLTAAGTGTLTWNGGVQQATPFTPGATTTYTVTADNGSCTATDEITITVNDAPTVNAGSDLAVCEGEEATLTATGTGTFSWDNGVQQAMPFAPEETTTYTVTADNGSCTATDEVTVTVNEAPVANAGGDFAVCEGEEATLTASGTGTFSWDNGVQQAVPFTPEETTTYTVTAVNGSCTATDEVTITVNDIPEVDAGADIAICEGQSVTLTATGTGTFSWNNDVEQAMPFAPEETATYTVTADNGNCTATDELTVAVNAAPTVDAGADIAICEGAETVLTATGTGTFSWNNGVEQGVPFAPEETAVYTVTAIDGGCMATDEITVTVNEANEVTVALTGASTLTATVDGAIGYQWIHCMTEDMISGATSAVYNATENGTYAVTALFAGGCISTSECISVTTLGTDEEIFGNVSVSPNPATDKVRIALPESASLTAVLLDMSGKAVSKETLVTNGSELLLGDIAPGTYLLVLRSGESVSQHRIIKQ